MLTMVMAVAEAQALPASSATREPKPAQADQCSGPRLPSFESCVVWESQTLLRARVQCRSPDRVQHQTATDAWELQVSKVGWLRQPPESLHPAVEMRRLLLKKFAVVDF